MRRRPYTGWGASDERLLAGSAHPVRDRIGNPIALAGRQPVRRDRQLGMEAGSLQAAEEGLCEGYDGYDAYTRTIEHCQDMLLDDTAEHGKA